MPFVTLLLVFSVVAITMNFTRENHLKGRAMSIENQISMEEDAGSGRVQIWKMTLKSIGENPILGTGPENLK